MKYGTPLQANNGRNPLIDAYQEALDLCVYLRQEIEERSLLQAEIDHLQKLNESLTERINTAHEVIAQNAERNYERENEIDL